MGEIIQLTAADGHTFEAYRAEPEGETRGAVVVIQEIFGVNVHIRDVADGFAKDGYMAIAPALFDRFERGVDLGYEADDTRFARLFPRIALVKATGGSPRGNPPPNLESV